MNIRVMMEIRARQVASECPLTWTQVRDLAAFAILEDGRAEFATWLLWSGAIAEVAAWLWEYWIDNAVDSETDVDASAWDRVPVEICADLGSPAPSGARPATARDAGQKQPRAACAPVSCR